MCLFDRQDDFLSTGNVTSVDAGSTRGVLVPEHISQIFQDANLSALLTDDVSNLSVRFQRVKITGEDISGVKYCLFSIHYSYLPAVGCLMNCTSH